ncbi:MAG: stage III sporulation protein AB [Firmicutes bacterium]|nr:stage III sporulation protein AB [Bacillota bacterium]
MLIKTLAAALILSASTLIGFYLGGACGYRLQNLRDWKSALSFLRGEIAFAAPPLPEALKSAGARVSGRVGEVLAAVAESLERKAGGFFEIWFTAAGAAKNKFFLKTEDWELLTAFWKNLGSLDRSAQIDAISLTMAQIDERVLLLSDAAQKSRKMYRSLGILGGVLFAVLLF